ncbi:AMP-binding protein [Methylocella sp. CPCC 101449]|jgi:crotonobetaine/carnitine-CoA ligase|uniref:AMP-binding protein n=1 Tax=Methylocella sp. CPCC 101449 TaxID=2987531 RepID=UPI00288F959D|nr:AMP-binding protein [Methylocella sp. CPCC 101449]MDT2020966.1 AMP-binding protein [Methylocella sp. CPCC 101449]HEV2570777.1 AMP-binding protein [Beijerinckiaceae bacterium]
MTSYEALPFVHPFSGQDAGELLRARAAARGPHPLLIWAPFDAPVRTWSYAEFAHDVACVAGGLLKRGIRPKDRILVHFENCPETLIARFACMWIGAIAVLSNAALAGPELRDVVEAAGVRAAITQPKFAGLLAEHCPHLEWIAISETDAGETPTSASRPAKAESFTALMDAPAPAQTPDPTADALMLFTTGTTSRAKGVVWTHANVLWGGKLGALQNGLRADDVYHIFLPLFHVVGFSWSFLPTLYAGATIVLQPRFSGSRFWATALEHGATVSSQVKFTTNVLAQQPTPAHRLRQFITASHTPKVARHFGVREIGGWGMTEMVAEGIVGDPWSDFPSRSIGRPSLGYRIFIEDDDGRAVGPGETGHLFVGGVRGLSIFREYDNNAQANDAAFDRHGRFITGDRVVLLENGLIEFGDRTKDVIKVGGEGVSGGEVEVAIGAVEGVREVAVVGRSDETMGEVVVAFVILTAGAEAEATRARILAHCRACLAKFKVPREIHIVEDFPRIGFGKVAKVKMREQLNAARTGERA